MIRFKKDDLGYTVASRAFRGVAEKCGNNAERQVSRVQSEYNIILRRHAGEAKFLRGVNNAFTEFMDERNVRTFSDAPTGPTPPQPGPVGGGEYHRVDPRGYTNQAPGNGAVLASYNTTYANPTYVPVPPPPDRWEALSPSDTDAYAEDVEMPYWQEPYEPTGMQKRAPTSDEVR